jgi:hypothetical protein
MYYYKDLRNGNFEAAIGFYVNCHLILLIKSLNLTVNFPIEKLK